MARRMTTAENWLDRTREDPLEPELPIIDPHHHFWSRPRNRYILDELLADLAGQNVRQTVFVECSSMYRAAGPEEFRVVDETEWMQGIAAQSASGGFGEPRAAAGIIGSADLRLGDRWRPCSKRTSAPVPSASAAFAIALRGRSPASCQTNPRRNLPTSC